MDVGGPANLVRMTATESESYSLYFHYTLGTQLTIHSSITPAKLDRVWLHVAPSLQELDSAIPSECEVVGQDLLAQKHGNSYPQHVRWSRKCPTPV